MKSLTDKVYGLLGLAMKAGAVKSGEFAAEQSLKGRKACLVAVPEDASDNTKKKFRNMAAFRKVPYYEFGTKEALGHALGRQERSSLSIEDPGFASALMKYLDGGSDNGR